jgi:hypothetical protein
VSVAAGLRAQASALRAQAQVLDELAQATDDAGAAPETSAEHLLDRRGLARALGCCVDVIDRLRREGAPELTLGDSPRFQLAEVLTWLRERRTGTGKLARVAGGRS